MKMVFLYMSRSRITEFKWHFVDEPYSFYKMYITIDDYSKHFVQIHKRIVDREALTVPEFACKMLRMTMDCTPYEQMTRTFNE